LAVSIPALLLRRAHRPESATTWSAFVKRAGSPMNAVIAAAR
jgi:hypothetical protein